ncbi:DMT family transporter [Maritimibacter dapengensis]|uniref:DMT family transporter n=1 Tax=Maritimibacter dapengensis TaxID=2836868 RepID=A0ABS6T2M8_9RHOB|nr:DMT family transporter [Maritimibacter dapengensis]MBV7378617.1 DMT family transporter [Maritimibacter dapengensis]
MENKAQPPVSRPVVGVLWMVVTGFCFVGVTAIVKHVGGRIPAAESAFLRYALGIVFLIPMLKPLAAAKLDRRTLALFGLRGVAHTFGVILWFYAMTQIPLAEVTAINYLNPVFVTIGAALLFGEVLAARRILAICVALFGALVILRPGVREIETGHIAMIGTAVFFAVGYLIAGRLAGRVPPVVVVAMLSITVTIGLAPFAAANWVAPTVTEIAWLFGVAAFATAGHYTMTLAFAAAPLTVTQPVTFLQLVWSVSLGAILFNEAVDMWVVIGGSTILAAVTFITWREAVLRRRVTPGANEAKF